MKVDRKTTLLMLGCFAILGAVAAHTYAKPGLSPKRTAKTIRKVHRQLAGGTSPVNIINVLSASDGVYSVVTNAQGQIIVSNNTGNIVRTLQMDVNVPVRQVYLLDNDHTIAAAQKDHTIFWDIATGNQKAILNEELYGFSPDRSLLFSYVNQTVNLYTYPGLQNVAQIDTQVGGPEDWNFSPDNHYLVIRYRSTRPAPDSTFPIDNSIRSVAYVHYYDLVAGGQVNGLVDFAKADIGSFSADSTTYSFDGPQIDPDQGVLGSGNWQYNLPNGVLTNVQ